MRKELLLVKKVYTLLIQALCLVFCFSLLSCTKSEDRAVWVVRFDLKTEENVKKIVRETKKAGFNEIIAQVYGRGDAYYNSALVPKAEILGDQPPGYDPLAVMIDECRKNGLKVHAWVNVYYIWYGVSKDKPESYPKSEKHIVNVHPEWVIKDATGTRINEYSSDERKLNYLEGLYADPSNEEYKKYFIAVCREIAEKYDIDGLHLDFVRYPGGSFGFNETAVADYEEKYGVDPFDISMQQKQAAPWKFLSGEQSLAARWEYYYYSLWIEHKSRYITSLVAELKEELNKIAKPGREITLSAAVFPDRNSAYFSKSQDWGRWLKEGYLDMIMPMSYYGSKQRVLSQIYNAKKTAGEIKVLAGLGAYTKDDKTIKDEILSLEKFNIDGFSFFSYGGITEDTGYLKSIRRKIFTPRAKVSTKKRQLKLPPNFERIKPAFNRGKAKAETTDDNSYELLLSEAESLGLTASFKEVEEFLDCLKKQFYSEDDFYAFLAGSGISEKKMITKLTDDITVFKYITKKVYPKVSINDDKSVRIPIAADYQMIFRYVHPMDSPEKRDSEKKIIDEVYAKLKAGEDFAELAKEYSRSAAASNGGYYKNRYYDEIDDSVYDIFSLDEGETTKVITRPSGFAIYKLNRLQPEASMKFKNVSDGVKKIIFYNALKEKIKDAAFEVLL